MSELVRIERLDARVVRLTLNRPARNNAFDEHLIATLQHAFDGFTRDAELSTVILAGAGKNFCAGGDLDWMRRAAGFSHAENVADAGKLAAMLSSLDRLPQTVIGCIQGAVYGGGVGLAACCDIAIASEDAQFCLSEVRLGLIPSVISPYVVRAIGVTAARRYFQTAEVFGAHEANRIGLVHEVVRLDGMSARLDHFLRALRGGAPGAKAAAKRLIARVAGEPVTPELIGITARGIADQRATPEAREGLAAFFDKRKPSWS
ncbi:MAG: enoyl-CoA hydratase/isomerase family protein [Xanthobacteraceae bacterium]|nr:MAG: enoyl-CoA hydratase/isomerase family protein [Xanthobacteraceae bacterium]